MCPRSCQCLSVFLKIRYRQESIVVSLRITSFLRSLLSFVLNILASQRFSPHSPKYPGSIPSFVNVGTRSTSIPSEYRSQRHLLKLTTRAISKGEVFLGWRGSGRGFVGIS